MKKMKLKNLPAAVRRLFNQPRRFVYHRQLIPAIWDENKRMRRLVSNALQMLAWHYIAYIQNLGFPLNDSDIRDIFVHGSSTNYYYDDFSDIDLCIVADLSKIQKMLPATDMHALMKSFLHSFLRNYRIRICGRGVDIEVADITCGPTGNKVGSIYSLVRDTWLRAPRQLTDAQIRTIRRDARQKYRQIAQEYQQIVRNGMQGDYVETFLMRLITERRADYYANIEQPVTSVAMAFRMARSRGILRRLKQRATQLRSQNFNINT